MVLLLSTISYSFRTFECSPSVHDPRKILVLPIRLLCWVLSTLDQDFVSFQPILCRPHALKRRILFHDERRDIPKKTTFSHPCFNKNFSNCLSYNSPAKRWPYRFRSRRTTGSSILDHDFGHLCRGRRIQMSGHSDFRIFTNLRASCIFTWVLPDTVSICCLSIATKQSGNAIHDLNCCHLRSWKSLFNAYCIRSKINFYNITAEQNSTWISCFLPPIQHFSNNKCPLMMQNEL